MSFFKCNVCGGTYQDPLADGSAYFHVCPDVPNPAFQPDPTKPNFDPRPTAPRPDGRDENILPGLQFNDGKYFTFERDRNDPAIVHTTEVKEITKKPGAGRTKIV